MQNADVQGFCESPKQEICRTALCSLAARRNKPDGAATLYSIEREIARSTASPLTLMYDFFLTSEVLFFNLRECGASWCSLESSRGFVRMPAASYKSTGSSWRHIWSRLSTAKDVHRDVMTWCSKAMMANRKDKSRVLGLSTSRTDLERPLGNSLALAGWFQ